MIRLQFPQGHFGPAHFRNFSHVKKIPLLHRDTDTSTNPSNSVDQREDNVLAYIGKYCKVFIYSTLGVACIASLIAALAFPDAIDTYEAQMAAVYLTLLIGSNKAFNAQAICGHQILGSIGTFIGTGFLPATIIHVAVAQIAPGQNKHTGTLIDYLLIVAITALFTIPASFLLTAMWRHFEQNQTHPKTKNGPT